MKDCKDPIAKAADRPLAALLAELDIMNRDGLWPRLDRALKAYRSVAPTDTQGNQPLTDVISEKRPNFNVSDSHREEMADLGRAADNWYHVAMKAKAEVKRLRAALEDLKSDADPITVCWVDDVLKKDEK